MEYVKTPCNTFQILTWWKVNFEKFSVLSLIVRDVLDILITMVAFESVLSTGDRVLDAYRNSLSLTIGPRLHT